MLTTPGDSASVSFILVSKLAALRFNPHRKEPLVFRVGSPEIRIDIRSQNAPGTHHEGYDNLECKADCVFPASSDVAAFVDRLGHGEYLPIPGTPITFPVRVRGEERIDSQGRILGTRTIPFEIYPAPVQVLWTQAYDTLTQAQGRFLRLLRWHQDIDGAHQPYDWQPALYWRSGKRFPDAEHYATQEPQSPRAWGTSDIRGGHDVVWDDGHAAAIRELWDLGATQPVSHELLCEARRLAADGSHRGALLMAATAVETGVKDHIGHLRPHTQWILSKAPSPPIDKLLREYIPEMHGSSGIVSEWKHFAPLWTRCKKLTEGIQPLTSAQL